MIPKVFLSLSANDDMFVKQVFDHLPAGLAFFYKKSFNTGNELIAEMEKGVGSASVFALFASKRAIASKWVGFEVDQARLSKILNSNNRIHVYPTEDGVSATDLPQWLQRFWIGNSGRTPKDIARHLRYTLSDPEFGFAPLSSRTLGRGDLIDHASRLVFDRISSSSKTPNVFVFSGIAGIGRRTASKELFRRMFPTRPSLLAGPELLLPQYADISDIYRYLRDETVDPQQFVEYEQSWNQFIAAKEADQISEVMRYLHHFGKLDQAVTIVIGGGLFLDDGSVKSWVLPLFDALTKAPEITLSLISNRQFGEAMLRDYRNVLHFFVGPLIDGDIKAVITSTSLDYGLEPIQLPDHVIRSIGGHPGIAKSSVRLLKQVGGTIFEKRPHMLFGIQDEVLAENMNLERLSDRQREILCILSWLPFARGQVLLRTFEKNGERDKESETKLVEELSDLILSCIVNVSGDKYSISSPVRMMFRRKHGHGNEALLGNLAASLRELWAAARTGTSEAFSELVDAFVYMHALEGVALPIEFRGLLPPSVLRDIVRDLYGRAREDQTLYDRVISWGMIAQEMRIDSATREDILGYVARAHARKRQFPAFEKIVAGFEAENFRSKHFLRGFGLRMQGKHLEAIPHLRRSVNIKSFLRQSVHELALCLQRTGQSAELQKLISEHKTLVESSAFMMDFLVGTRLAEGKFSEAEAGIQKLRFMPDEDGRATRRDAQLLMRRDRNYRQAVELLDTLIDTGRGVEVHHRGLRSIAAAYAGDRAKAEDDIQVVVRRMQNGAEVAKRLNAHLALASGNFKKAQQHIDSVVDKESMDHLLSARVKELEANDINTPLHRRQLLLEEAQELRLRYKYSTDLDVSSLF